MGTLVTDGAHGATATKLLGGVAAFGTAGGKISSPIFAPKYDNGPSTRPGKFEKPTDPTEHGMEWFDGRQTARKLVKDWEEMRTDTNTELAALHVVLGRFRKLMLKNSSAAGGAGGDDTSSNTVKVIETVLKVRTCSMLDASCFTTQLYSYHDRGRDNGYKRNATETVTAVPLLNPASAHHRVCS